MSNVWCEDCDGFLAQAKKFLDLEEEVCQHMEDSNEKSTF